MPLREDAQKIIDAALLAAKPDHAVQEALQNIHFDSKGQLILVAIGKAAWQMAYAAYQSLQDRITKGIVITKYDHVMGELPGIGMREAGHPIPDENSFLATQEAIEMVSNLHAQDHVLFLISGGGSALFEDPLVPAIELQSITSQLLKSGADISEINTIRKRLSRVKGGRFAQLCAPARVDSVILSDIIGDPLDMIASGPAYPDSTSAQDAFDIVNKYQIKLSETAKELLKIETPKTLSGVNTQVTGSVKALCEAAKAAAETLGYQTQVLTDSLTCQAREAGSFLASIARFHQDVAESMAFIAGGETVVRLTGNGKGGRNQEIALSAAIGLDGLDQCALFSLGSDGTDGPTDAAGGYVDGSTIRKLRSLSLDAYAALENNDAYPTLQAVDGLLMTGPTGTNVNDVTVLLIKAPNN